MSIAMMMLVGLILVMLSMLVGNLIHAAIISFFVLLFFCALYCFRKKLQAAIVIVKLTGVFVANNASVYLIPLYIGLLSIIFTSMLALCSVSIWAMKTLHHIPVFRATGLYWLVGILTVFFSIFVYYLMVYMVASAVAHWIYQRPDFAGTAGCSSIFYHLGSITFASVTVAFTKILQVFINTEANSTINPLACFCLCIV